jgi:TonB family protein
MRTTVTSTQQWPLEGTDADIDFIGPRVISQVMPNTRDLPHGVIVKPTRVNVETRIDSLGRVSKARLINFDEETPIGAAALAAAKQWKFEPAKLRGQPVESDHTIVFEFQPEE